jgi:hypothetical protein
MVEDCVAQDDKLDTFQPPGQVDEQACWFDHPQTPHCHRWRGPEAGSCPDANKPWHRHACGHPYVQLRTFDGKPKQLSRGLVDECGERRQDKARRSGTELDGVWQIRRHSYTAERRSEPGSAQHLETHAGRDGVGVPKRPIPEGRGKVPCSRHDHSVADLGESPAALSTATDDYAVVVPFQGPEGAITP